VSNSIKNEEIAIGNLVSDNQKYSNLRRILLVVNIIFLSILLLNIIYQAAGLLLVKHLINLTAFAGGNKEELRSLLELRIQLFWIFTVIIVSVESFFAVLFYRKVYKPIVFIESSINSIVNDDQGFVNEVDSSSSLFPLANGILTIKERIRQLLDREYASKLLAKQAELNVLQSQINPHFLYNTLEAIRSQALMEGVDGIADMTKALASIFRYSISQSESIVTLADELQNIDNYLTIQQYRFSNRFKIQKRIDEKEPEIMNCRIPNLTLQPIVENAFIHGLEARDGAGQIKISAYLTEERVVIHIEDDGIGMTDQQVLVQNRIFRMDPTDLSAEHEPAEARKEKSSIGLTNVNERIHLVFGTDYGLHLYSTRGIGTNIEISLPRDSSLNDSERVKIRK